MIIYEISVDVNKYQWVLPGIPEEEQDQFTSFDCRKKEATWETIEWEILNPLNEMGNFFSLGSNGVFAFDEMVLNSDLFSILESAGEILPITTTEGTRLFVMNILVCINALDEKRSSFHTYDDGTRGAIKEYVFKERSLPNTSLFKIPQTHRGQILCYSGLKDKDDEFKYLYDKLGFKGLVFNTITT